MKAAPLLFCLAASLAGQSVHADDRGYDCLIEPNQKIELRSPVEALIDDISDRFDPPTEFVVPGETVLAAHLDVARTVVRRAERDALATGLTDSLAIAYLNRLSDLVWTLARWKEGGSSRAVRQ